MTGYTRPGGADEEQKREAGDRNARSSDAGPEAARSANAGSRPDFEQGAQTDDAQGPEQRSFQTPPGGPSATEDLPEDHYEPSPVEATRAREQGLGLGARDLQRQRDPQRPVAPPDEDSRPDGE